MSRENCLARFLHLQNIAAFILIANQYNTPQVRQTQEAAYQLQYYNSKCTSTPALSVVDPRPYLTLSPSHNPWLNSQTSLGSLRVSDEDGLIANLPAMNAQQAADARHQQLLATLGVVNTNINARLDGIDRTMTIFQPLILSSDQNSKARCLNSSINRDNSLLEPLRDQRNNIVAGFPNTLSRLSRLNGMTTYTALDNK